MLDQFKTNDKGAGFSGTFLYNKNSLSVDVWIIDSCASDHIIFNKKLFSRIYKIPDSPVTVHLPNGNITNVTTIGTIHLAQNLILTNVLYIPEFEFNLL